MVARPVRHVLFVALVGLGGALLATTPADVATSRENACLAQACRVVATECFEAETAPCAAVHACVEPCADGDESCMEPCMTNVDRACAACMRELLICGRKRCAAEVAR